VTVRCLVIGWDAADASLVDEMLAAGELPVLQSLQERGTRGPIEALPGLGDDAHWATFATGLLPGEHGRFHHRQTGDEPYIEAPYRRTRMTDVPFWSTMAANGPVASLDVPKSPRGEMAAGSREVIDWLCHGEEQPQPSSQPPRLAEALTRDHPVHRPMTCYRTYTDPQDIEAIARQYQEQVMVRTATILNWWDDQDWDLFLAVYSESHCMGHHAWNVHDPAHFSHISLPSGIDPVKETYRALDRELGKLVDAAGSGTAVVVFSLIGMGANNEGTYLLDEVLLRLEPPGAAKQAQVRLASRLRSLTPVFLRRLVPRKMKSMMRIATTRAGLRVYAVQHDATSGAIRVNLKGREPQGLVEPGDYDAVLDELERELRQLVDPDNGRTIVSDVVRVREQYPGPQQDIFADLLVVWEQSQYINGATSPRIGTVKVRRPLPRPGNHRPGGWYVSNRAEFAPSGVADLARAIGDLTASQHGAATAIRSGTR